jgi:subtilisin-like proprotein convertase family protein
MAKQRLIAAIAAAVATMAFTASTASAGTFNGENATEIKLPDPAGKSSPYGTGIDVQGVSGRITNVVVSIRGLSYGRADDLDFLLVAPNQKASVVMASSCGTLQGLQNKNIVFAQGPPAWPSVPANSLECGLGPYAPTDRGANTTWPAPAPAGTHPADFDQFIGDNPNGEWKLYVADHRQGYIGKVARGWTLGLETQTPAVSFNNDVHADPYPATRTVTGVDGLITDLNVTLSGIYHERFSDADLLLVGPQGQKVMLSSDACASGRQKNASFTWDDEAPSLMSDQGFCPSGTYKPTDYEPGDVLPAPAPGGPYSTSLSAFDYTDPNGDWKLYAVDDDQTAADGFIVDQFQLEMKTRPKAKVAFASDTLNVTEGQTGNITLVRAGTGPLVAGAVQVTSSPLSATSGKDYKPVATTVQFAAGETEKTVPVEALTDGEAENPETLKLEITAPTGDAELSTPAAALVTIRDVPPRVDGQQGAGGNDGGGGNGPAGDKTAPTIGGVKLSPARFAVTRGKARNARRGTTISYSLSEAANVSLQVERRVGRRWVKATTLAQAGRAGSNRKAFSGKVGRKALQRGKYRLVVTAVDAAGNRATAKPRPFQIVNPR